MTQLAISNCLEVLERMDPRQENLVEPAECPHDALLTEDQVTQAYKDKIMEQAQIEKDHRLMRQWTTPANVVEQIAAHAREEQRENIQKDAREDVSAFGPEDAPKQPAKAKAKAKGKPAKAHPKAEPKRVPRAKQAPKPKRSVGKSDGSKKDQKPLVTYKDLTDEDLAKIAHSVPLAFFLNISSPGVLVCLVFCPSTRR